MSNVLPLPGRLVVKRMYRARFIITGSLVLIAAAFIAALALFPSYFALHAATSTLAPSVAQRAADSDRQDIVKTQALLAALGPIVSSTTTPSDVVSSMLALKPAGLRIDHITYASGDTTVMTIAGSAETPATIDAYRKALAALPFFTNVSVPVGDLVGAQNGRFSMTLQLRI